MSQPIIVIEICPSEPRVNWCSIEAENDDQEVVREDILDCCRSGDSEPACRYLMETYKLEFRIVAKNENGEYENRLATEEEKKKTAEAIFFESDSDFSDEDICNMYLVWEMANQFQQEEG